jgi:signal transduction histidine kinase
MSATRVALALAGAAIWGAAAFALLSITPLADGGSIDSVVAMSLPTSFALAVAALISRRLRWWPAAIAAASCWLVPELAGVAGTAPAVASVVEASAWAVLALAVLAGLSALGRHQPDGLTCALVLGGATAGAAMRLLLVDPFLDIGCRRVCAPNPWVLPGAGATGAPLTLAAGAVVVAGFLAAVRRISSVPGTRVALVGDAVMSVGLLALAIVPAVTWVPVDLGYRLADVGGLTVGCLLVALEVRERAARRGAVRLAVALQQAPEPGQFLAGYRELIDDPDADVRFWHARDECFLDAEGRHVPPAAGVDPVTVVRDGRVLAVLSHGRAVGPEWIETLLGPALRLALENDQLRAMSLADLREVESSRDRLLQRVSEERRRLERDLHDGVQQRAVSVVLLLRILRRQLDRPDDAAAVDQAGDVASALLSELRAIARGIHPAVVGDAGLGGALLDLADSSDRVAVTITGDFDVPLSAVAATTAYSFVATALAEAGGGAAQEARVTGESSGQRIQLLVEHDAQSFSESPAWASVAARAEALTGRVKLAGGPGRWQASLELPCVS